MKRILIPILCTLSLFAAGCDSVGSEGIDEHFEASALYDVNMEESGLVMTQYQIPDDADLSESVRLLLQRMIDGKNGDRMQAAIPSQVSKVTFTAGAQTVTVDFDSSFNDVSRLRQLLCEAAVVRTLCRLDDVYAVSFAVDGMPLTDLRGNPIGVLTPDSFAGRGFTPDGKERGEFHLFFASADGQSLVERVQNVTYCPDVSPERAVVENLIAGPKSSDAFATIDPATAVEDVMTRNGVCYISLSRDFLNKTTNVSDKVVIYSLVNSLTSLGNVNKVRITVDGGSAARFGEYDLSQLFERSLEMTE